MASACGSRRRRAATIAGLPALAVFGLSAPPAWSVPPCAVTTTNDAGPGSLRQALLDLDASNGGFCREIIAALGRHADPEDSNLPTVHWPFTLSGPGPSAFTIDGAGHSILRAKLADGGRGQGVGGDDARRRRPTRVRRSTSGGGLLDSGLTVSDAMFTGNTCSRATAGPSP